MALIPPTNENLESGRATKPLTEWLIQVAKSGTTMSYGRASQRLEVDCGFDVVVPVAVGRVAGAAMNRIRKRVPDAPLLNVLLVRSDTLLPGSGAVSYLKSRYPKLRWLRRADAHKGARWRELVEEEATLVYGYPRWDEVYQASYGRRLPAAREDLAGTERDGTGRGGGEGVNHRKLKRLVARDPSLVRRGLKAENTVMEAKLLSGDQVDVVSVASDRRVAIEVKSRDSDFNDLQRGVYQCVKYRAVMEAQHIGGERTVEAWLVTETALPTELRALARRLGVRTKVIWRT